MAKSKADKAVSAYAALSFEDKVKAFKEIQDAFYKAVADERELREQSVRELDNLKQ